MRRKKKCPWCKIWFKPNPRLKQRQISCGNEKCVLQQSEKSKKQWLTKNQTLQRQMVRDWFAAHSNYLQSYREQHPEYCDKNRRATQERMRQKRLIKGNDIV